MADPIPTNDEKLRVAINRLQIRIVNEHGSQDACDRLEVELAALHARLAPRAPVDARARPERDGQLDGLINSAAFCV